MPGTNGAIVGLMKKRSEDPHVDPVPMPPPSPAVADELASPGKQLLCRVCGSPGASKKTDMLCWVCRRLKISAWKDAEKLTLPE